MKGVFYTMKMPFIMQKERTMRELMDYPNGPKRKTYYIKVLHKGVTLSGMHQTLTDYVKYGVSFRSLRICETATT